MKTYFLTALIMILLTHTVFSQAPIPIDVQQAIELTKSYIEKNNIDVSKQFISSIILHPKDETHLQPYWTVTYITGFEWLGGAIDFTILADSTITHQFNR